MKRFADSTWKQRGAFFAAGVALAFVCGFVQFKWMDIVPYAAFDLQPDWLKGLKRLVGWLPWIAFALVVVLRFIKGRRIRWVFHFLGTATPTVALIGWLFLGDTIADMMHRQKFSAETWQKQETVKHDTMWPPRLCMVDDLMASGRLMGMSSNQVVELLGPPHDKSFPFGAVDCDIHYYLGPERGFIRIDSEWLFLKFGPDGKVNRQWRYRD